MGIREYTPQQLDDAAIADSVNTFIAVQARDWQRRQRNRVLSAVFTEVDYARQSGDSPDVPAIIRKVWLNRELPLPELGES